MLPQKRVLLAAWSWLAVAACSPGEPLDGPALRALFADRTVEGYHELAAYHFRSYYGAEGTFRSYQGGAEQPRRGRWWVQGDRICIRWQDGPLDATGEPGREMGRDLCRRVLRRGDKHLKTLDNGDVVVTFVRFTGGNPGRL